MIKSFRGTLASGGKETIRLSTNKGEIGYTIKKFQIIDNTPGTADVELVSKVFTNDQSAVDGVVDFSNSELLAVSFYTFERGNISSRQTTIFDNVKVNQDIYITAIDGAGGNDITNYYLELEQFKLDLSEATVATLKDMRGTN